MFVRDLPSAAGSAAMTLETASSVLPKLASLGGLRVLGYGRVKCFYCPEIDGLVYLCLTRRKGIVKIVCHKCFQEKGGTEL